jgi:hypothetical protein
MHARMATFQRFAHGGAHGVSKIGTLNMYKTNLALCAVHKAGKMIKLVVAALAVLAAVGPFTQQVRGPILQQLSCAIC